MRTLNLTVDGADRSKIKVIDAAFRNGMGEYVYQRDQPVLRQKVRHEVASITVKPALQDFTRCSTSGFLTAREGLGTIRSEAAETM
jgi:hypothetical protein